MNLSDELDLETLMALALEKAYGTDGDEFEPAPIYWSVGAELCARVALDAIEDLEQKYEQLQNVSRMQDDEIAGLKAALHEQNRAVITQSNTGSGAS